MTTEQKLAAEFEAILLTQKKEAQIKVSKSLNLGAVEKLKEATEKLKEAANSKAKKYIIEDVTPEGCSI